MTEKTSAMAENADFDWIMCPTASAIMHPAIVKLAMRIADNTPDTDEPMILP